MSESQKTLRSIRFPTADVRSTLAGTKTTVRIPMKPQPNIPFSYIGHNDTTVAYFGDNLKNAVRCPYGRPGDHLWVRETHRFDGLDQRIAVKNRCIDDISYRADMEGDRSCDDCNWRPSIHMPQWASRITLEIIDVQVGQIRDITEEEAIMEGVKECGGFTTLYGCWTNYGKKGFSTMSAKESYRTLWESIYDVHSWHANFWVWIIKFQKI
jgi:hypothetical protein